MYGHLDVHVEVEIANAPLLHGEVGVVDVVGVASKTQFGRALGPNIYETAAKNFIEYLGANVNFGDDAFAFNVAGCLPASTLFPIGFFVFFTFPAQVFFVRQRCAFADKYVTYFFTQDVAARNGVVLHHLGGGPVEVQGIAGAVERVLTVLHRIRQARRGTVAARSGLSVRPALPQNATSCYQNR